MADDLTPEGQPFRIPTNVMELDELAYWAKQLGISSDRLRQLVETHGVLGADSRLGIGPTSKNDSEFK